MYEKKIFVDGSCSDDSFFLSAKEVLETNDDDVVTNVAIYKFVGTATIKRNDVQVIMDKPKKAKAKKKK
jgi:hypothetical protein